MNVIRDTWTQNDYSKFLNYLYSLADEKYRIFNSSLVPGCADMIIGVRIPKLRRIAKDIAKGNGHSFIECEKGITNEEIIIDGLVRAEYSKTYEEISKNISVFVKRIKNWAVNDVVKFNNIKKCREEFRDDLSVLLSSGREWETRYGLKILMDFYLDDTYIDYALSQTLAIRSDAYYVCAMQGWLLATAAVKYGGRVEDLIRSGALEKKAAVMAADKIRDSRRISGDYKEMIRQIVKTGK